ncbi:carboxymuconolactone decarboxylase family protein [Flavobacterium sp. Fl-77]|uniref:Carboxymuconolactone decarboxylase family protein n=1 Tax=Flavobacterium flavipigmentatum TaxID=2893884 RepID=A0AAJ2SBZ5_9FLAO|nr:MULTISPECIES: carboxymuconolactone decarboxylase family protein [unclassified Flavobacterium]MDX6181430.1 carboxymuconolactone decarboxylase family protein [Flavobacterium sp. Fl-33]MDX6185032.1 carboxymuconolactone decarboxylase family protein [Flavobacterium sp. Fl-77]UFH40123.1 carboxymuconolactone decarboxylase family protein [Flavobacterium sp. F-70]
MTRLTALNPEEATGKTKDLFNAVQAKLGAVPNMMRTLGNSPAALEGYLNLSGALSHGKLSAKTGELLALAISESNSCDYCLAAHTYIGEKLIKADPAILHAARIGNSEDSKTAAILKFAKTLISKNGLVNNEDVNAIKNAGVSEAEIAETVAHVALNVLTNYFNNTANTEIDFPVVESIASQN